ncbi:molybdate ABC transporter substrate-binding protein [Vibrio sp. LaRot3]|uniref:molybdate ABC transporter substrate-binding protein n=1 Tax=Vibrio sp. LaRot3 TaxID=2998829 RepID=UPI0022CE2869|nr:molybdate ABC transporter substrate-binding protein [Vibrio sp. LaRot3]MDA0148362.1 molybdate ABC transporter substrate-binding protein [Vibrio sp. LaRot3]
MKMTRLICAAACLLIATPLYAQQTIRVYAASSLTNVVNDLIDRYEGSDVSVVPVYGGSSSLARQIERGAPADVYLSANNRWVDHLVKQEIAQQSDVQIIARNQLVLANNKNNPVSIDVSSTNDWLNILKDQRLAVGQTNAVPAGIYAKQALQALGVWQAVSSHLAPTNNVRVALTLLERQEVPLAIVYATDAKQSDGVEAIHTFADQTHQAIEYPLVTIKHSAATDEFVAYLLSEDAQHVFAEYGFK